LNKLKLQRSYDSFFQKKLNKRKPGTVLCYKFSLKDFENFCNKSLNGSLEETIEELKISDTESIIDILQDWINQTTVRGNNVRVRLSQINNYLYYRGVKIDSRDLKDLEYEQGDQEERRGIKLEELQRICEKAQPLRKALYISLASSGMAIGEAIRIRKSDLDFSQSRIVVNIKTSYTKKNKRGRSVYLSNEAQRHLQRHLDKLDENALVFGQAEEPGNAIEAEQVAFRRVVDGLGLGRKYDSGVRMISLHALRAYFFTKATQKHGIAYAHKLTGHKNQLEEYNRYSDEKKLEMYQQLEPELYVFFKKPESEEIKSIREELGKLKTDQKNEHDVVNSLMFIANGPKWGYSQENIDDIWKDLLPKLNKVIKQMNEQK